MTTQPESTLEDKLYLTDDTDSLRNTPSEICRQSTDWYQVLKRWYMLGIFAFCNITIGCAFICFSPLFSLVIDIYGVSLFTVNWMTISYCIIYLPMNFPSTYILDKYGLRVGLTIGMLGTTVGLWIRCLINHSFWFAVAGQTLMAVMQPFIYNCPAKLSGNWFPER